MKKILTILPAMILMAACSDGPKVVTDSKEIPEALEPKADTDGYVPYAPEHTVALIRDLLLEDNNLNALLARIDDPTSKIQYVGAKDMGSEASRSIIKEDFKAFLTKELDRMEKEYPQYSKFMFTQSRPSSFYSSNIGSTVSFKSEEEHVGLPSVLSFRMHENMKWQAFGEDTAAKEQSLAKIEAHAGMDLPVHCYGEYTYSNEYAAVFDLTRCDVLAPTGEIMASTEGS